MTGAEEAPADSPGAPGVDLETEYDNGRRVPEEAAILRRWERASAGALKAAQRAGAILGEPYGEHPRERFDLYPAGDWYQPSETAVTAATDPLVMFIHGGYWQSGERGLYRFLAQGLAARGLRTAIPSYPLAPDSTVSQITASLRRATIALVQRTRVRPVVVGHSAGGHLAAEMLATDWVALGMPADLVSGGLAVSGVFDLRPLVDTSWNRLLGLDRATAAAQSPGLHPPARTQTRLIAAFGGTESGEFRRQSRWVARRWSAAGAVARAVEIPGANHFTVIDRLADPTSGMAGLIAEVAQ